jgi:hypothetical protein
VILVTQRPGTGVRSASPLTPRYRKEKGHQTSGLSCWRKTTAPLAGKTRLITLITGSESASLIHLNKFNGLSFRMLSGHSERPLIMPTDLDAAVAARKREEQAQTRALVTMTLVWAIISLGTWVVA